MYYHLGHQCGPARLLPNCWSSWLLMQIKTLTGEKCIGECVHHDFLGNSMSLAVLGQTPSLSSIALFREVVGMLIDTDLLQKLCRIITHREKASVENPSDGSKGAVEEDYSSELNTGSDSEELCSEAFDKSKDSWFDEDIMIFSEPSQEHQLMNEVWLSCTSSKCRHRDGVFTEESHRDDPVSENDNRSISWDKASDQSQYFVMSSDFLPTSGEKNESNIFNRVSNESSIESPDNENKLPCLNHNISLASMSTEYSDTYTCVHFPLDEMSQLGAVRKVSKCDLELIKDAPIKNITGSSPCRDHVTGVHYCIETVTETCTLPGFPIPQTYKYHNVADDGALGDEVHIKIGIHPVWCCRSDSSTKGVNGVFPSPSTQDRQAKITYKTQLSDATCAETPMFIFSSAAAVNGNLTTARTIPLERPKLFPQKLIGQRGGRRFRDRKCFSGLSSQFQLNINNNYSDHEDDKDSTSAPKKGEEQGKEQSEKTRPVDLKPNTMVKDPEPVVETTKKKDIGLNPKNQNLQGLKRKSSAPHSRVPKKKLKPATESVEQAVTEDVTPDLTSYVANEESLMILVNGPLMSARSVITCPKTHYLQTMDRIVFVDIENYSFFKRFHEPILPKSYTWLFLSGRDSNEQLLEKHVFHEPLYLSLLGDSCVHISREIGRSKDAADVCICLVMAKLDDRIAKSIDFFVISKDRAFEEVHHQFRCSLRRVCHINPYDNDIDSSVFFLK